MTDSDLQRRVVAALSPTPVELAVDVIAYRASDKAPVTTYTRFLGEHAATTRVQNPHDERAVLAFLSELDAADLAAATRERPVALCASRAAQSAGFDLRVVVHPSVARASTSHATAPLMAPLTVLTFPAFECEFTRADTADEVSFRLARVVPHSKWDRPPAPVVNARYVRPRARVRSLGGKWLGPFKPEEMERTLRYVLDEGGSVDVENFKRELATIRVDSAGVEVLHGGQSQTIAPSEVLDWYRSFVGKGLGRAHAALSPGLEPRLRFAYASAVHAERGALTRGELERVGETLASLGECLPVAAAWTAAQAAIFPQLDPALVALGVAAIQEVARELEAPVRSAAPASPALLELSALLAEVPADALEARQAYAARCLLKALACCVAPSQAVFADAVEMWALAAADPSETARGEQERWTAWLDDVVTRADRFTIAETLQLLERTLRGMILDIVPNRYTWEGSADEQEQLHVWTRDPTTKQLVRRVITYSSSTLKDETLRVVVARDPELVRDRLRIEHFFEHVVHRRFLDDYYWGRYRAIEYELADGSDRWSAPR